MADLVSLKKELKCWESMFARKHGRKPSKEDIDGSSDEIKDTYRQYASIKSKQKTPHKGEVQSPPVLDDSGWGNDLLKESQHAKAKPSKIQTLQIHKHHRPTFKLKKLRKNEDEENSEKEKGVECEEISSEKIDGDGIMTFEIDNKIANTVATKNVHRKSVTSLRRRQSLFKNCSNEWLNTCKENIDSNIKSSQKSNQQPQIYNISDDNMNNFDSQTIKKDNVNDGASNKPVENCTELHHEPTEKQFNANKDDDIISKSLNHEGPVKDYDGGGRIVEQNYTKKVTMEELIADKPHTGDKPENTGEEPQYNNSTGENPSCGRAKSSRAKVEENFDTEDEIVPKEKLVIRKIRKKQEETSNKNEDEIEVEEKAGKRKRKKNTESEDNVDPKVKKIKLNTTKSKKLVSQNFVKVDLRKKTYTRGTQGKLTGAQYKRRQWKQKTSFELPSKQGWQNIGKKVCFKCGGEGHWAKFCRGRPKKVDPFSKLNEERASIDFDNLDTENKSCFDYLGDHTNENQHNEFLNKEKVKFTIDDVLDIQPVWPRQPLEEDLHEGSVSPLYTPVGDQPSKEAYAATEEALQTFGFDEFREGQHDAAARIVSGLSTLVILSTGSGKSLCYQLPAYLYYKHNKLITLVVSPLVALMQDQVANLPSWLPGACLNSNMTKLQQKKVVRMLKAGEIAVLLISPEALVSGGFGSGLLPSKDSLPPIAFACVDEAHCLSEWSHNFRPSYLMVCKALRERYDIGCLLGLTATASQTTATSVTHHLGITGAVIRDPQPVPDNLFITASRDPYRDQALIEMLQTSPFSECASIIVYVTRRLDADRLAALLRANLPVCLPPKDEKEDTKKKSKKSSGGRNKKPWWWTTECYHAGLSPAQRRRVQTGFMSGELRVVVATVAFGMGLDKRDVRAVIHYNMPSSFENYVQEIGRAGRDGEPAYVHVFLDDQGKDLCELRRHIYSSTIDRTTVNKLIDVVFPVCSCTSQQKEVDEEEEEEDLQHMTAAEIDDLFSAECDIDDDAIDGDVIVGGVKDGDVINKSVKDGNVIGSCDVIEDKVVKNEDVGHSEKNENEIDFEVGENEDNNASSSHVESSASVDQIEVDSINRSHQSILRNEQSDVDQELSPCFGHRVAFGIDSTVQALDMPKVNISTILAYLELHPRRWLKVLNPLRDACTVKCYGGPEQFQLLGRRFAPIALALRQMPKSELRLLPEMRSVDLSFARIADLLCCEALTVAREVRGLQWNMTFALDAPLNTTGQSGIIVECEQLSFHIQTTQKVIDEDRDDICDFIHDTVDRQEETRLLQLDALYNVLRELSRDLFHVSKEQRVDAKARQCIGRYFLSDANAQTQLLKEMCVMETRPLDPSERRWNSIAGDIGALVSAHPESRFSGRAVARIFHGIDSPCFPALAFGRDKRFWRQYLDVDFNLLRRFASEKLVHYRR